MNKTERQKKYKQIEHLAEWANTNRNEIAQDGISIIIGIATDEKAKKLCMTGRVMPLYTMLEIFRGKMTEAMDEQFSICKDVAN